MVSNLVLDPSPRMVVTTHFLELFEYNLFDPSAAEKMRTFKMDYLLPEEEEER